jgi:hypothetical protein
MLRRFACGLVAALALAPVAAADGSGGPSPGVVNGGSGATLPGSGLRFVALNDGNNTYLEAVQKRNGAVLNTGFVKGTWGVPLIGADGSTGGLSPDLSTLVLGDANPASGPNGVRKSSSFIVVDPQRLTERMRLTLRGDFSFDALSPSGQTLFLIQHVSTTDLSRYVVRAYDLQARRMLPGRIADRTQRGWVMTGYAMTRTTSADGRWVYTLYRNDGGYPFVHALDTVNRKAHCIGVPWTGTQDNLSFVRLSLRDSGRQLLIYHQDGANSPVGSIDTQTYRFVRPTYGDGGSGSFPWWAVVAPAGLLLAGAAAVRIRLRRTKPSAVLPT